MLCCAAVLAVGVGAIIMAVLFAVLLVARSRRALTEPLTQAEAGTAAAGGGDGGWRRLKRSERTPPLIAPAGIFLFCLQVLGLEAQPSAPHSQGSSHGLSRIIRLAYFEHPSYVPLLRESYRMWRDLEAQSGEVSVWQTFIEWHGRMAG